MRAEWFPQLVAVMSALAAGDDAALFVLYDEFGGQLRAAVRRELHRLHVAPERDLVDDLVIEAALVVRDVAKGWHPDRGALPWVWAERRIASRISTWIGQHTTDLDLTNVERPDENLAWPDRDPAEDETFATLARMNPTVALLDQALAEAASLRERIVLLAYEACKSDGDPSPAKTLAPRFGLSEANVRQIVSRTKAKVRDLVARDPRFEALRGLPILS